VKYICKSCGTSYEVKPEIIKCDCGAALWLDFKGKLNKQDIIKNEFSLWRYSKAYPIQIEDVSVTYKEGLTPLANICYKGHSLLIKQDNLMPTGSFKDRGVTMVTNYLKKSGVTKFAEDSSGNGGSSYAGFSALGHIDSKIFVPAGTSEGKIGQMKVYGSELVEISGSRSDVTTAAMQNIGDRIYVGHNWHPFFVQGVKSVGYEIWEQNNFKVPDNIVCVAGNGSMVVGIYMAFTELLDAREIKSLPRIYAIQADSCNTLYRDFVGKTINFEVKPSIAEGISIYRSTKHDYVLEAIRQSNGEILSVSEEEIKHSLFEVGRLGFYIEPTSATGFAGLNRLIENNSIQSDEQTAIIISGNGLKATQKILDLMKEKK